MRTRQCLTGIGCARGLRPLALQAHPQHFLYLSASRVCARFHVLARDATFWAASPATMQHRAVGHPQLLYARTTPTSSPNLPLLHICVLPHHHLAFRLLHAAAPHRGTPFSRADGPNTRTAGVRTMPGTATPRSSLPRLSRRTTFSDVVGCTWFTTLTLHACAPGSSWRICGGSATECLTLVTLRNTFRYHRRPLPIRFSAANALSMLRFSSYHLLHRVALRTAKLKRARCGRFYHRLSIGRALSLKRKAAGLTSP